MADETAPVMDEDTQRLFDAAGITSTPQSRQAAKDRIAEARRPHLNRTLRRHARPARYPRTA